MYGLIYPLCNKEVKSWHAHLKPSIDFVLSPGLAPLYTYRISFQEQRLLVAFSYTAFKKLLRFFLLSVCFADYDGGDRCAVDRISEEKNRCHVQTLCLPCKFLSRGLKVKWFVGHLQTVFGSIPVRGMVGGAI